MASRMTDGWLAKLRKERLPFAVLVVGLGLFLLAFLLGAPLLQHDPEGVAVVIIQLVAGDLDPPPRQIGTVEQAYPLFAARAVLSGCAERACHQDPQSPQGNWPKVSGQRELSYCHRRSPRSGEFRLVAQVYL